MNGKAITVLLTLITLVSAGSQLPAEDRGAKRTFHECFLYRGSDGAVWVGQPLVSLGMIGVRAFPPQYRLGPPLAERFAPLVNQLQELPEQPQFWWWGLPSPKSKLDPLVLVRIETEAELRRPEKHPEFGEDGNSAEPGHGAIYEITSANLICAEFVAAEWRRAWKSLDANLEEIVIASRNAPSEDKMKRLSEAIEKSSRALNTMVTMKVDDTVRKLVRQIEPNARAVRLFQRNVAGSRAGEWGGQLREYVSTLRINPRTPLPKSPKPCPKIELLARCDSPEELIASIRESWPEEVLEETLIYSNELRSVVLVWQVESLTRQQFAGLREEAQRQLARRKEQSASNESRPADVTIPEWSVVLRPTDDDVLAQKGLLRGTSVVKRLGEKSPAGLQAGDVIIDYDSVYDLVMGRSAHSAASTQLANKAKYGGQLDVLRGNQILTIKLND